MDNQKNIIRKILLPILILVVVVAGVFLIKTQFFNDKEKQAETLTMTTLKKINNISEFSTFQAVYNGVAKVMNKNDPEQLDYYVSYKAKVNAGFDFKKVEFSTNVDSDKIIVIIPDIEIKDVNVDIGSLDFIFLNKNANTNTVLEQAYAACIEAATNESKEETAIYELAKQNAENIMEALISPFLKQLESEYELEIKWEV